MKEFCVSDDGFFLSFSSQEIKDMIKADQAEL